MRDTSDTRIRVIGSLLIWAAVFAASFIVPMFIAPTGESFFRGLNRIAYWFWLQVAAFVVAIIVGVWAHARRADLSRRLVWLSRVPLLVAVAEILAIAATIMWAAYTPL
jgi:predicted hotdog family 3-hydroxylacyl-ACP dehydratase